ncbi:helix-turn-helix transcriptional regulator [Streptomyces sp. NBC_00670]|jgi:transcriptional regulator with XRE-family HTH domain|uniref:helix-turn-helix transcriptional regulator n=1 Tax=Streptomyces sp. NBC_00670 TaxID=2975804 RepID=UPI002E32550E|nr:helix-turn-helix transcriptional regulator [Streptomyces sp. NBC_00670]
MPTVPFGHALRLHRVRAGLSLSELSARVHYSSPYLSRLESGERRPSPELARLCDVALGAGGALAGLVAARERPAPADGTTPPATSRTVPLLSSATSHTAPILPPAAVCPVALPAADDAEDIRPVTHYALHLAELRRLAQRVSPSAVLGQLGTAVALLETLARAAHTAAVRRQYVELLAFYAEFAGWMAQEAGDEAAAERWIGRTEALATEAGAADLADHTLIRRACLALYRRDARSVVEYAVEAGRRAPGSPRVRGLAALREAQGLALAGRAEACDGALRRAAGLLGTAGHSRPPALAVGSEVTHRLPALVDGWCLHDLGRPEEAAERLHDGLLLVPVRSERLRSLFTARLALSLAACGRLEALVPVVDALLKGSAGLCSHTVRSELRLLAVSLRRRYHRPDMRELHARVTAALHCAGCAPSI